MSHILEGKTIISLHISEDKKALRFLTDVGEIIARTEGGCGYDSWVEHIEIPALGFPARVISADDIDMPSEPEENQDGNTIEFYGFKIITDKGEIIIDYRNESNGYYGGDLIWPGELFYVGIDGQNKSNEIWKPCVSI